MKTLDKNNPSLDLKPGDKYIIANNRQLRSTLKGKGEFVLLADHSPDDIAILIESIDGKTKVTNFGSSPILELVDDDISYTTYFDEFKICEKKNEVTLLLGYRDVETLAPKANFLIISKNITLS